MMLAGELKFISMTVEAAGRRSVDSEVRFCLPLEGGYSYDVILKGHGQERGGYVIFSLQREPAFLETVLTLGAIGRVYCGFTGSRSVDKGEEYEIGTSGVVLRGS